MKQKLKDIFSINTIIRCFIDALAYGLSFLIPSSMGCSFIISLIICFIIGTLFDTLIMKILDSKLFNSNKQKIIFLIWIYALYIIGWTISYYVFNHDLDIDFFMNTGIIVGLQILMLLIQFIKSYIKKN